eukprot:m.75664 g.75664  ORF g.75664 m.75664 type:complete len:200 (-) comp14599_c0_seq3:667-1266(-)
MAFHFSKEKPDDQLVSDLANTNRFSDEIFQEFIQLVFSFLTQPKQATRMMAEVEAFASTHSVSPDATKAIVRAWMTFIGAAQRNSLTPLKVLEDLSQAGLPTERGKYVGKLFHANLVALSRSVAGRSLMVNQLVDMEWRFGVTAGSDAVEQSGASFLQLRLTLLKGTTRENVFMELTLPQFYTFLQEMERAKASLDYLS